MFAQASCMLSLFHLPSLLDLQHRGATTKSFQLTFDFQTLVQLLYLRMLWDTQNYGDASFITSPTMAHFHLYLKFHTIWPRHRVVSVVLLLFFQSVLVSIFHLFPHQGATGQKLKLFHV